MQLGPNQTAWVRALRSGAFTQAKYALRNKEGMCCLGVACELYDPTAWKAEEGGHFKFQDENGVPPNSVQEFFGLKTDAGEFDKNSLASENDNGKSFAEIADIIEAHADELFSEAK